MGGGAPGTGGPLHLDLHCLLAERCLVQGSSGAGKSATLRHLIEEARDCLTIMIVDPEGEFGRMKPQVWPDQPAARSCRLAALNARMVRNHAG